MGRCIERISPTGASCPSQEHGLSKYPRLSEESEKESRDEATPRGMEELYQRQYGSRLIGSGGCKGVMWADLRALQMRQAEQLNTSKFIKENARRASMMNPS